MSRPWLGTALAIGCYFALALGVTFPFILHPADTLTAPLSFDVSGSVSTFQTLIREHQNPFVTDHFTTIGWPEGVTTSPGVDRVAWLNTLVLWFGSLLLGAVTAHSLLNILGLALTATVTLLFVRSATGSLAAGFVAGLTYGFWPHMYLIGSAAPTYTWMWLLLLPVWAYHSLSTTPSMRVGLIAGLAPIPAMFWTPYFALHICVVTFACAVVLVGRAIVVSDLSRTRLLQFGLAAALPTAALAAYLLIGALSHFSGVPTRSIGDAYQESAHPLMYVIPGWGSIWGTGPDDFLVRVVPRAKEANLYVGYTVILLSLLALGNAARVLWVQRSSALQSPLVVLALLATAVIAFCFLFSLPPRLAIGHRAIPMPDDLVLRLQPAFRGGQRFVMPLMSGMSLLAALGTLVIVKRLPHRMVFPVVLLIAMCIWLDLFAYRPNSINRVPQSPALAILRMQPSGPVFQYIPPDNSGRFPAVRACLLQPQHDKPLVDTCEIGPQSSSYETWISHRDCTSVDSMRTAGVRYVIVDDSLTELISCMSTDRKVADDGRLSVYALS